MFFGKKKKEENKEPPVEEVQKLLQKGMDDKDVIKKLKSKGYSHKEIETAMIQAMKEGIQEEGKSRGQQENMFSNDQQYNMENDIPELTAISETQTEQAATPEVLIEELIEGVVEEKWKKFESRVKGLEDEISRAEAELKLFRTKMTSETKDVPSVKDFEAKIGELSEQLEDMRVRIGGLEKAFKQILPSLTRNIESLSDMIHGMKSERKIEAV